MMWEALREAVDEEMEKDSNVLVIGVATMTVDIAGSLLLQIIRLCLSEMAVDGHGSNKADLQSPWVQPEACQDLHACAGEDVGHYGGSYKVTYDLHKKYGDMRLLDTPICGALLHAQHISPCCVLVQAAGQHQRAAAGSSTPQRFPWGALRLWITFTSAMGPRARASLSGGAGSPHHEL